MARAILHNLFFFLCTSFAAAQQPNIVIFFSDDHTNQAISAYQDLPNPAQQDLLFKDWAPAQTPNIDRLANQGVIWRNSYVNNSICSPSRANLLTGLHSHANGLLNNSQTFNGGQQTFPKLLQAAGYNTGLFGKWHLKSTPTGFDHYEVLSGDGGQGFYYNPVLNTPSGNVTYSGQYVADVTTDRALTWLQDRIDTEASDPFLIFVNHKGTHRVWQPGPQETAPAAFRPVEWDYSVTPNPDTAPGNPASWTPAIVPVPSNFDDRLSSYATRASGARTQNMEVATNLRLNQDLKLESTSFGGTAYDEVRTWWNANKGSMTDAEKHAYYQQRYLKDYMLTGKAVDRGVGEVLDFLEANDLDHNTIILYASDQGFYLGEHGWYDKRWMYQESFRTPLIIQWKDASGNSLVNQASIADEMVQVMDIGPTVLEAAGVSPASPMHGDSFLGYLTAASGDEPGNWQDSLYYHYHEGASAVHNVQKHYGVFDGRYKLIHHYELAPSSQRWELFDLQNDPLEMNNLLYNPSTGVIDNPEDGIEGDHDFQVLVYGLMVELANLRTEFNDTTGTSFSLPPDPGIEDNDPPTLTSFANNRADGPIFQNQTVTYTVTFDEPINASTLGTDDFENTGSSAATIDSVSSAGNSAAFEVTVSPGSAGGTLQLQVKSSAVIEDLSGNALVTNPLITDPVIITVNVGVLGSISQSNSNTHSGSLNFGQRFLLSSSIFSQDQALSSITMAKGTNGGGSSTLYLDIYAIGTADITLLDFSNGSEVGNLDYLGSSQNAVDYTAAAGSETPKGDDLVWTFNNVTLPTDTDLFFVFSTDNSSGSFVGTSANIVNDSNLAYTNITNSDSDPLFRGDAEVESAEDNYYLIDFNPVGDGFSNWIEGFPEVGELNGFSDDPDGDDLSNGVEAFFNTDPSTANNGITQIAQSGNLFSFQHPEAASPIIGMTASYKWSLDLSNWNPSGTVDGTNVIILPSRNDPSSGITTVTADTSASASIPNELFLRIEVNNN